MEKEKKRKNALRRAQDDKKNVLKIKGTNEKFSNDFVSLAFPAHTRTLRSGGLLLFYPWNGKRT